MRSAPWRSPSASFGLGSLVNLAWLVGSFYVTSLLFVVVILGLVAPLCGFLGAQADPLPQGRADAGAGHVVVESAPAVADGKMEKAVAASRWSAWWCPRATCSTWTGTNIYMTLAALFIAQATNTELTLGHQVALLLRRHAVVQGRSGRDGRASSPWPPPWPWCLKCRWLAWR